MSAPQKNKMKEEAKKQYEQISIAQIKEILTKSHSEKFDKMIITGDQSVKRGNYIFIKVKYQKVDRHVELIKFPLHGIIKDNFAELEGGENKYGERAHINSNKIFESLKSNFKIIGNKYNSNHIRNPFEFSVDEIDGEIATTQKKYFYPDLTYQETCKECKGEKYITCTESKCNGRHNWTCTICHGDGKVSCNKCTGDGKVTCKDCKGHGYVKCGSMISISGCNGKGYKEVATYDKAINQGRFLGNVKETCSKCHGKGEVPCKDCGTKGEVKCEKCSGRGDVECKECSGRGDITCKICYGDKERYGRVDCPECDTIGTVAQIVYVNTLVNHNEFEQIILKGDKLEITDNKLIQHIKSNQSGIAVFKKVNEKVEENHDEFSKEYTDYFENELCLSKNSFPMVTKEDIYYQVVPCVELSYKHMLTNSVHEFAILDIWNNPEIIFHSEPEKLKQDLGNATKAVGGFFGKLFKTKGFKTKEDKKNEIILMIHLVKCDGKIEDQEKISLSEAIGHLEEFTNSEKQNLFDLMNGPTLPELTKNDTTFSSKERSNEVIEKLTNLALADGEIQAAEKEFIERVKNMI